MSGHSNPYQQDTLDSALWKKSRQEELDEEHKKLKEEHDRLYAGMYMSGEALGGKYCDVGMSDTINDLNRRTNDRLRYLSSACKSLENNFEYALTHKEEELYLLHIVEKKKLDRLIAIQELKEFARNTFRIAWKTAIGCVVAGGAYSGMAANIYDGVTNPFSPASSALTGVFNYTQNHAPDTAVWHVAAAVVGVPTGILAATGAFVGNGGTTLARGAWNLAHYQSFDYRSDEDRSQAAMDSSWAKMQNMHNSCSI